MNRSLISIEAKAEQTFLGIKSHLLLTFSLLKQELEIYWNQCSDKLS